MSKNNKNFLILVKIVLAYVLKMAPRGKELPIEMKNLIIKHHNEGKSIRKVAELIDRSPATVQKILKKYEIFGTLDNMARSGRPRTFTEQESRLIIRKVKKNPKISAPKLQTEIGEEMGKQCNAETIRRALHKAGYNANAIRKKPYVSKVNRQKRLEFAKGHTQCEMAFWNSVIFSDESKFNIHGSDGRDKVWRKPNTQLDPMNMAGTVKHGGGSVMVWGCMAASGEVHLVFIENRMDRFAYLNILKNNLHQSAQELGLEGSFIFQQDNDPKHTSLVVREWLLYNVRKQLKTPPQSPDLNAIEHLWDHLERQIRKHEVNTKAELKTIIQEEWGKISPDVTQKLVASMPSRISAVIKAKGYPTRY